MKADAEALKSLRITAGMPLDLRERIAAALVPLRLAGGEWLFAQGDVGDALYLVASGRLEVVRSSGGVQKVVATLQAGDTLGELALLEGGTRAAGARALRDSDLYVLHRDDVAPLLADPHFSGAMLRVITRMVRADPMPIDPATRRSVIAFVGADPRAVSQLVEAVATSLAQQRVTAAVLRSRDPTGVADGAVVPDGRRLDELERDHEVVLLDGGAMDGQWSRVCARQADRVVVLGGPSTDVPGGQHPHLRGCDLVVSGDAPLPPAVLDLWGRRMAPRAHHRLRPHHHRPDVARMARRLTGRALGLVLSGGGARGLAHIGVLQAVEEAGLVVDRFGGTSMGALLSALAATGRTSADIRDIAVREMVRRQPFRDYTVPRVALIRGVNGERMLQRVFGAADVRHLPRAWFGVSAALDDATLVVHRRGSLWESVACSISLPGLAPPRVWEGRIVVDGGVLDNLPVGVMFADGEGQVIAADVTRQRVFGGDTGDVRLPGIVETLSATMGLSSQQQGEESRRLARIIIDPDVGDLDLLDFSQIDRAIAAGLAAGRAALAGPEARLLHQVGGG